MNVLAGKVAPITPGVAVGFDGSGNPTVFLERQDSPVPEIASVVAAARVHREALLREVSVITTWLAASEPQRTSSLVVPRAGGLVVP